MKRKTNLAICFALICAISFTACANTGGGGGGNTDTSHIEFYTEEYERGMIETYYDTKEVLIADYVIGRDKADPTGKADATEGIRSVLSDCAASGGGTVFLPRGKYRVTSNIYIPPFVYLQGDYSDPDSADFNGFYGTVILADVATAAITVKSPFVADKDDKYSNFPALFTVGGSSAVNGLSIYYPNQDPNNIKPYPFAFEIPSFAGPGGSVNHMAATIKNVTLINAYKGICVSVTPAGDGKSAANEVLHLENIKGTALYQGMQLYNSSEVGIVRDVSFSPLYWVTAPKDYQTAALDKIEAFGKTYGTGLLLGDLEWDTFTNIRAEGYKIGVRVSGGLRRYIPGQPEIYFIGQFYNLNISNCVTGLRVDNLYPNFGINIAGGEIAGSLYSINDNYTGLSRIRVIGVKLSGDVRGDSVYVSEGESEYTRLKELNLLPGSELKSPQKTSGALYDAVADFNANPSGNADTSLQIQQALDRAGALGGGTVYLKAGYYRIGTPLSVPAGVELRGSASANTRDQIGMSRGTVLLGDYGYAASEETAKTATALVTLSGDKAGISGIRVVYPKNAPLIGGQPSFKFHSYAVRAVANGNYVRYMSFVGVPFGIEFKGDKKLISGYIIGVNGCYYRNGINVENVEDMYLEECLSNSAVLARHGYENLFPTEFSNGWVKDGPQMTAVYDMITRPNSKFITVKDSSVSIGNSFTFGSHSLFMGVNSDVKIYNSAGDNLKLNGNLLYMKGGSLLGVNIMRYQGQTTVNDGGTARFTLLNILSLHMNWDNDTVNNEIKNVTALEGKVGPEDDTPDIYTYLP